MPDPQRSLRRSRTDRKIAGVLGGIARYFDLNPTHVRVGYVVLSVLSVGFPGVLVYIILWVIIPDEEEREPARDTYA